MAKRFQVALSYPGEHGNFVAQVADSLRDRLGQKRVLFDKYHEAEFARVGLDAHLQQLYHDDSELVVVFLCPEYEQKRWCRLEWRAIRDLIETKEAARIMLAAFPDTRTLPPGLYSSDGYVPVDGRSGAEIAELILQRLQQVTRSKPSPTGTTSQPAIGPHNLPYPPLGDLFKGREGDLHKLRRRLTSGSGRMAAIVAQQAIHGLGGVGKTRLAIEYAWRYADQYTALLFVSADGRANLRQGLADLCRVLNLPELAATDEPLQVEAALRFLAAHPGWLMILDNVDNDESADVVLELLPRLTGSTVLITSRRSQWPGEIKRLPLDVLPEIEAVAFLLQRTATDRQPDPADESTTAQLAAELGCLALALEQAAAYICRRHERLSDYLERWRQEDRQGLDWYDPAVMHYPRSVATTWQTSVEMLSEAGRDLLRQLAWLAPEPIPASLITDDLRDAAADMVAYGLARWDFDEQPALIIHRLAQDVTRTSIPPDDQREWIERSLRWVNEAAPTESGDVRTWPVLTLLQPHIAAVVGFADQQEIADPTGRLMNALGLFFKTKALYAEAEPLMRRALAIGQQALGNDHPNVAIRLNNLALLLQDTNRLEEAEPLMRWVLAIGQQALGDDHSNVAGHLNNLAQLLKTTNRPEEAEAMMRRALAIDERALGDDHPAVGRDLNNLAQLLQATNRLEEAEPLMRRALVIGQQTYGDKHPEVAGHLNNLAQLLKATNRLGEAEPLMRQALEIDQRALADDHPAVGRDLDNLAQLLQATNRLEEAEPLMRRALEIGQQAYGDEHPEVAGHLNNLAQLLQATNRLEEAEPLMRRALAILRTSLGDDHPRTQIAARNYAVIAKALE